MATEDKFDSTDYASSPKPVGREKYDKLVDIAIDDSEDDEKARPQPAQLAGVTSLPKNHKLPKLDSGAAVKIVKRIVAMSKPERPMILLAIVMTVINGATGLAIPGLFGQCIDVVNKVNEDRQAMLASIMAQLGAVFIVGAISGFIKDAVFEIVGQRVVCRVRTELFRAIIGQEVGFFDNSQTGELTNRLSADTETISGAITWQAMMLVRHILTIIFGLIILFVVSWKLTLCMLGIVPPIIVGALLYGRFISRMSKTIQDALAKATAFAQEAIMNVRTVRAFAQEEYSEVEYAKHVENSFALGKKRALGYGGFSGVLITIANLGIAGVIWFGSTLVINNEMSAGTLTSFILFTLVVAASFGILSSFYANIMKAVGSSQRVFELIDRVPAIQNKGGVELQTVRGEIEFRRVCFSYPSRADVQVLSDVDFHLTPGQTVALVGPSGHGKSTVVHLIERFYDPSRGRILLDGVDITTLDPSWYRRHIGLVNQEPVLFNGSIRDNICYGIKDATMESIQEAATFANAHNFISAFPQGYDTVVGERGIKLSGGQKQRVAIARAMLLNPKILLLDEATSALDAESEHLVQEALNRLMDGRTTLLVAHRLSTVQRAHQVLVIVEGKVEQRGSHSELIADKTGLYFSLVQRQLQA